MAVPLFFALSQKRSEKGWAISQVAEDFLNIAPSALYAYEEFVRPAKPSMTARASIFSEKKTLAENVATYINAAVQDPKPFPSVLNPDLIIECLTREALFFGVWPFLSKLLCEDFKYLMDLLLIPSLGYEQKQRQYHLFAPLDPEVAAGVYWYWIRLYYMATARRQSKRDLDILFQPEVDSIYDVKPLKPIGIIRCSHNDLFQSISSEEACLFLFLYIKSIHIFRTNGGYTRKENEKWQKFIIQYIYNPNESIYWKHCFWLSMPDVPVPSIGIVFHTPSGLLTLCIKNLTKEAPVVEQETPSNVLFFVKGDPFADRFSINV